MPHYTLDALRDEYDLLLKTCQIRPERLAAVQQICDVLIANQARYETIAAASGVPWFMVGVIHSLEGSLNFATHLHNGDPLNARTVHVPAGRPKAGNPPFTFEDSAIDALALDHMAGNLEISFAGICFKLEGYNGFGTRGKGIHTPYLWSFSNHYTKGKYYKDGPNGWDPNLPSRQCGAAVILRRLLEMNAIDFAEHIAEPIADDPLIRYSNHKPMDPEMVERVKRFQRLLNTQSGIFLIADGTPGTRTSDAVHTIFGHYLPDDPRA